MVKNIAILEDNLDRQAIMGDCLAEHFAEFDVHFFDESSAIIRFLEVHLAGTAVIALDNDLELKPGPDGRCIDPGSGCDVAEFLASKEPTCPIIIHTTNTLAAAKMEECLSAANWKTHRVIPFDDMNWIRSDWLRAVRRAIVGPAKKNRVAKTP